MGSRWLTKKEKFAIVDEIDRDGLTFVEVAEKLNTSRENISRIYYQIRGRSRTKRKNSRPDLNPPQNKQSVVLVIPDMHHPFCHPDTLDFLRAIKKRFNPSKFVCLGDEADFHAFSKYPKDPDGMGGGLELQKAKEHLIPFYVEFPEMMVCTSNHTVRPLKRMFDSGLPEAFYPSYSTILNAPDGWKWKDQWEIDGVLYIHGEGRSGANAHLQFMKAYKKSVVIGHIHSYAAVSYEGGHFAMNTGCLINQSAYAFKYARHMPVKISLGCGLVFNGKSAHFIPLHTDENGRWTGRL